MPEVIWQERLAARRRIRPRRSVSFSHEIAQTPPTGVGGASGGLSLAAILKPRPWVENRQAPLLLANGIRQSFLVSPSRRTIRKAFLFFVAVRSHPGAFGGHFRRLRGGGRSPLRTPIGLAEAAWGRFPDRMRIATRPPGRRSESETRPKMRLAGPSSPHAGSCFLAISYGDVRPWTGRVSLNSHRISETPPAWASRSHGVPSSENNLPSGEPFRPRRRICRGPVQAHAHCEDRQSATGSPSPTD